MLFQRSRSSGLLAPSNSLRYSLIGIGFVIFTVMFALESSVALQGDAQSMVLQHDNGVEFVDAVTTARPSSSSSPTSYPVRKDSSDIRIPNGDHLPLNPTDQGAGLYGDPASTDALPLCQGAQTGLDDISTGNFSSTEIGCRISTEFDARILRGLVSGDVQSETSDNTIKRVYPALSGNSAPEPTGLGCQFERCEQACVVRPGVGAGRAGVGDEERIDLPLTRIQIDAMRPAHARDIGCVRFRYRARRLARNGGGITIPSTCTLNDRIRSILLKAHKPPASFAHGNTTFSTDQVHSLASGCIGFGRPAGRRKGSSDETCTVGCTVLFNSTTYFTSPQLVKPVLTPGAAAQRLDFGIAIDAPWFDSWQHFILDALSSLGPALPLIRRDKRIRILVPSFNKMQRKWFTFLGIDASRIVVARRLGKRRLYYCGRNMLTVMRASRPGENHDGPYRTRKSCTGTAAVSETARAMLPPLAPGTQPLAIYVSRKGKSRTPPNEREVLALIGARLRAHNRTEKLVVFVGHEHSFEEQLQAFQRATVIVGSQGGGHVARVVSPLGAVNIQFSPIESSRSFKSMMYGDAGCRFVSYHVVTDARFRVPLDDLRLTLDLALQNKVDTMRCLRF
jgi:hypothetical protein